MNRQKLKAFTLIFFMLLALAATPAFEISASAESGRVTFNDPSAQVGQSLAVYMSITSGNSANWNVASVDITLSYDTEYLQYISSSEGMGNLVVEGGGGTIHVTDHVNSGTTKFGCYLRFNTLKAGSTKVKVESCTVLDRSGNRFTMYHGTASVTINDSHMVASLERLAIDNCELYPAFSSQVYDYTAYALYSVTEANLDLALTNRSSSYRISGDTSLEVGENIIQVVVTAQDGTTVTYTVTITRLADGAAIPAEPIIPTPSGANSTSGSLINEDMLILDENGEAVIIYVRDDMALPVLNFTDNVMPTGFVRSTYDYNGTTIPCCIYEGTDEVAPVFCLKGMNNYNTGFYYFDEATSRCTAVASIQSGIYSVVDMLSSYDCPEGYREGSYMIGGSSYNVFTPKDIDIPNHYIVCAINRDGLMGLYVYDMAEETLQRYDFMELAVTEAETEVDPNAGNEGDDDNGTIDTTFKSVAGLLRAMGFLDDDDRLSNLFLGMMLTIFALLLMIAILFYVMAQRALKYKRTLKFNVPPSSVRAEAMEREAARQKLAKKEARKARKLEKLEARRNKRKRKAEKKLAAKLGSSETTQPVEKVETEPDTSLAAIPGMVAEEEPFEDDVLRYDLGSSEGQLDYDREIAGVLSELGLDND